MNGAANIGIDITVPADTEVAGLGDDRMRSIKTTFQTLLNDEHNVPTGTNSGVGYHLQGSARPYYGTFSRVSSDGTDSRLMLASDTSQLFGLTSTATNFIGGPRVNSIGTTPGTNRHHWVEEIGADVMGSNGSVVITFPNSGYSGKALVWITGVSPTVGAGTVVYSVVSTSMTTSFIAVGFDSLTNGYSGGGDRIFWRSLGTRLIALSVGA